LLLGSLRQHELTEAAELLNVQLQAAIIVGKKTEEALIRSEKLPPPDAWLRCSRMRSITLSQP
jgi:hypothetical protein